MTSTASPATEQLNVCQLCGATVQYGDTEHGFPGFVHDATGTTVCPADAAGKMLAAIETAAQALATETAEAGHPTVAAYGETIDENEAIDEAMAAAGIPAMSFLHLVADVVARADALLSVTACRIERGQRFHTDDGVVTVLTVLFPVWAPGDVIIYGTDGRSRRVTADARLRLAP